MSINYSRWDKIEDTDASLPEGSTSTRFDGGDGDFVAVKQVLLDDGECSAARGVPRVAREVWQVCVRALRCWTHDESAGPATTQHLVRPLCVLVACLFPSGRLLTRHVQRPPASAPSPREVMGLILRAILDPVPGAPEHAAIPQHRPSIVTFVDRSLAAACAHTLAQIGIECSVLSEAHGMDAYVRGLSQIFIDRGIAARGDVSEKPGMLTGAGMGRFLCECVCAASRAFFAARPWTHMSDRQTLRITAPVDLSVDAACGAVTLSARSGPTAALDACVFVSVIGRDEEESGRAHTHTDDDAQEKVAPRGLCVFFKRYDAEYRILSPLAAPAAGESTAAPAPPAAVPHPCDCVCAHTACPRAGAVQAAELRRCTGCRDVYYCSPECQRADWPAHKARCKQRAVPKPRPTGAHWGAKEMVLLFDDAPALPIDDLDLFASLGYQFPRGQFPVALTFNEGTPVRPSAAECINLTRALLTVCAVLQDSTLRAAAGDLRPSAEEHDVQLLPADTAPDSPLAKLFFDEARIVRVRTDPILTAKEAAAIARTTAGDPSGDVD